MEQTCFSVHMLCKPNVLGSVLSIPLAKYIQWNKHQLYKPGNLTNKQAIMKQTLAPNGCGRHSWHCWLQWNIHMTTRAPCYRANAHYSLPSCLLTHWVWVNHEVGEGYWNSSWPGQNKKQKTLERDLTRCLCGQCILTSGKFLQGKQWK